MPTKKQITQRRDSGKLSDDEQHALTVGESPQLEDRYGSLRAAEARHRQLWSTGQLRTNPGTRPNSWWLFDGPKHLRNIEAWIAAEAPEYVGRLHYDHPSQSYEWLADDWSGFDTLWGRFDTDRRAYLWDTFQEG